MATSIKHGVRVRPHRDVFVTTDGRTLLAAPDTALITTFVDDDIRKDLPIDVEMDVFQSQTSSHLVACFWGRASATPLVVKQTHLSKWQPSTDGAYALPIPEGASLAHRQVSGTAWEEDGKQHVIVACCTPQTSTACDMFRPAGEDVSASITLWVDGARLTSITHRFVGRLVQGSFHVARLKRDSVWIVWAVQTRTTLQAFGSRVQDDGSLVAPCPEAPWVPSLPVPTVASDVAAGAAWSPAGNGMMMLWCGRTLGILFLDADTQGWTTRDERCLPRIPFDGWRILDAVDVNLTPVMLVESDDTTRAIYSEEERSRDVFRKLEMTPGTTTIASIDKDLNICAIIGDESIAPPSGTWVAYPTGRRVLSVYSGSSSTA